MRALPLRTAFVLLLFCAAAPSARADSHLAYVRSDGKPGDQVYIKAGKVRAETGPEHGYGLIDTSTGAVVIVSREKKRYYVFDEAAAARVSDVFEEQEKKLNDVSKKTRDDAAIKAAKVLGPGGVGLKQEVFKLLFDYAMKTMISRLIKFKIELRDLGMTEKVSGFVCRDEELLIRGKHGETRCVTKDLSATGMPDDDVATAKAALEDYRLVLAALEPMAPGISTTLPDGLIVRTERLDWDPVESKLKTTTNTLQSISTATLSADLFLPPPDYARGELEDLGK